ncbi:DUF4189 domain-containing protein [Gordonia neofelifaecis]|uniref:DUF4189 domain-containing protein n=1 Tax=Gordonia neofelifaecis NRRL B-59395 TaxID=644548 RepID=F1YEP0_9ACTN|nr:DUF4189 domain-containing protein [Gordonia neofelifaecis]EGD56873.1 hypothetical protein SCNU_00805 [Gordonia neofelifaecis NRRL B-59395]
MKLPLKLAVAGAVLATGMTTTAVVVPEAAAATPYYGAIAISQRTGRAAVVVNYHDGASAQRAAARKCGAGDCRWVVRMYKNCGAAAQNPRTRRWGWAYAPTLNGAKARARNAAGGGRSIVWGCTIRPN